MGIFSHDQNGVCNLLHVVLIRKPPHFTSHGQLADERPSQKKQMLGYDNEAMTQMWQI